MVRWVWVVMCAGQGYQLGIQVLGVVVIAAWTCCLSGAAFWLLHKVRPGRHVGMPVGSG